MFKCGSELMLRAGLCKMSDSGASGLASKWKGFSLRCALLSATILSLAGCQETTTQDHLRATRPIPSDTIALMQSKGTDTRAPILIRAFKKEAELEIWKMTAEGNYTHLKTFPMCRWSGQLGPKVKEGDRQVPEGFYTITPGQMNPSSNYYLSFNVGYPNAYDKAHNYTGGLIMVHGACSSAGCYSMTDEQIAEIYAIARESFGGGQKAIQMQSFPFRMTAENLAKHRLDPNLAFWKELKQGSDRFEVTKQETPVSVCARRYVFDKPAVASTRLDPQGLCPPMEANAEVAAAVLEKQTADDRKVAELVASGVKPVRIVYQDGGQHPQFSSRNGDVSRPDALAQGPTEIELEADKPVSAAVKLAISKAQSGVSDVPKAKPVVAAAPAKGMPANVTAFAPDSAQPSEERTFFKKLLNFEFGEADAAPEPVVVAPPAAPARAGAKSGQAPAATKPQAALKNKPAIITGAAPALQPGFMASAPVGTALN